PTRWLSPARRTGRPLDGTARPPHTEPHAVRRAARSGACAQGGAVRSRRDGGADERDARGRRRVHVPRGTARTLAAALARDGAGDSAVAVRLRRAVRL